MGCHTCDSRQVSCAHAGLGLIDADSRAETESAAVAVNQIESPAQGGRRGMWSINSLNACLPARHQMMCNMGARTHH